MQQHSAIHDPRTVTTPSQRLAARAHNMRQAKIAASAMTEEPRRIVTFAIPNTPFGVSKSIPWKKPPEWPAPAPAPVQRLWCDDLIKEAERVLYTRRVVRIEDIQIECALHYGVSREAIISPCRKKAIVKPRQIAMYLSKKLTDQSLPQIGRRFGNRDHTTGLHAVKKMARLVAIDTELANDIEKITAAIKMRIA